MKLVPLGDRVVLKQVVAEETTKSGIVISLSALQLSNVSAGISVIPSGIVIEVNPHLQNADSPISVSPIGSSTESKLEQPLNAS